MFPNREPVASFTAPDSVMFANRGPVVSVIEPVMFPDRGPVVSSGTPEPVLFPNGRLIVSFAAPLQHHWTGLGLILNIFWCAVLVC